jgi:hypothetical protein
MYYRTMASDSDLICVVTIDIDKAVEDDFNVWYERHIRDVVACPGWVRATRYRCLDGEPRYMSVYDIAGREFAAYGSVGEWPEEFKRFQEAGYEEFWPHVEGYRARTYERISQVHPPESPA